MEEVIKFHNWLEKMGNIYLSDFQSMDRAYEMIRVANEECNTFVEHDTE